MTVLTKTFADLGLPALLVDSLAKTGFTTPTPIQEQAIPPQLNGRDILGIAQTGSGKTAAFGLPILAGLLTLTGVAKPMTTRALILAPTRELAVQIDESLRKFAGAMRLSTVLVLGGVSRYHQVKRLERGVDITIATPGRLKDLIDDKKIKLNETRWLVLDEADRMLDMGFIGPVREIAAQIGSRRQTALFSATMAPEVAKLAASLLNEPVRVEASPQGTTVAEIDQRVILSGAKAKRGVLNELLADEALARVIIFSRTKHGADRVTKNLEFDGHKAAAIHGNKSQNARQAALKGFASGQTRILVATDIAARGIDVPGITHVINYELPDDAENYVHRIGRTARNGASGFAITLCDSTERSKLRDVERLIRKNLPVSGDLHSANETGVVEQPRSAYNKPAGGRPSQPRGNGGRPGQGRPGAGGKPGQGHNPKAKPFAAVFSDAPSRGVAPANSGRPRADGEKVFAGMPGSSKPGNGGKPRWDKDQKNAGRARRSNDGRPRSERVAG
jgi:ATP-dependent RNA helicase RhlE